VLTFASNRTLKTVAINLRRTVPIALLVSLLCSCERSPEPRPVTASTPIKRPQVSAFQSQYDASSQQVEATTRVESAARVETPHILRPKAARPATASSAEQTSPIPKVTLPATGGTLASDPSVKPTAFEVLSRFDDPEPAARSSAAPASSPPPADRLAPVPVQRPPTSLLLNGDG
jgi:hypothetical protein